jgi:hypothetical protein
MNDLNIIIIASCGGVMLSLICVICLTITQCLRRRTVNDDRGHAPALAPAPPNTDLLDLDQMEATFGYPVDNTVTSLNLSYGNECHVCGDIMDGKSTIGKIGGCKHAFHRRCIMTWYATRAHGHLEHNCPVCRERAPAELIVTKVIPTNMIR